MDKSDRFINQDYLQNDQYQLSTNLAARIRLHQLFNTAKEPITQTIFNFIIDYAPANAKVLGVGSGRGDLWKENAHRVPDDWDITLTDMSAGMLQDNQAHIGEPLINRIRYEVVNAENIPFDDNSFDIVIANYMLYHVPNREQALAEIRRVLKPTGTLFAATNGKNHMKRLFVLAQAIDEGDDFSSIVTDKFSLQNGTAQLLPFFPDIRIHRFQNDLWVTEAQPILDYIASMMAIDGMAILSAKEDEIRDTLNRLIAQDGGILIGKETGIFIASGFYESATYIHNQ
ncbi:MAG: class I SAM-dependent methyltransferase [Chloroflexota bacterium]